MSGVWTIFKTRVLMVHLADNDHTSITSKWEWAILLVLATEVIEEYDGKSCFVSLPTIVASLSTIELTLVESLNKALIILWNDKWVHCELTQFSFAKIYLLWLSRKLCCLHLLMMTIYCYGTYGHWQCWVRTRVIHDVPGIDAKQNEENWNVSSKQTSEMWSVYFWIQLLLFFCHSTHVDGRHGIAPVGSRLIIGTQQDKAAMRVWSWEKDQPLHKYVCQLDMNNTP